MQAHVSQREGAAVVSAPLRVKEEGEMLFHTVQTKGNSCNSKKVSQGSEGSEEEGVKKVPPKARPETRNPKP